MSKVIVVTDSNSGITPDDAKKLGVEVIPMPFYIDEQMYYENIDLTQEQFYEKLTAGGDIKTSMPLVGDVTDKWDEFLKEMMRLYTFQCHQVFQAHVRQRICSRRIMTAKCR